LKNILLIATVFICIFLFCGSASAANNWTNETVSKGNFTNISLALNSTGDPSISYFDANNNALEYAYKSNGTWTNETVAKGNFGENSLEFDKNDSPSISYYDITNNDLEYAYKSNGTWNTEIVGNGGNYNSLVMDSYDNPCISYSDANNYIEYANLTNGIWNNTELYYGNLNSLAIDSNNNPNVFFYDGEYLWYQYFANGAWNYSYVGSYNNVTATSLVIDSINVPHVSFINNGYLNYAYENNGTWIIQNTTALNITYNSLATDPNGNLVSTFDVNNGSHVNLVYAYQNYNYDTTVWYGNIIDTATTPTTFQSIVKLNSKNDPRIIYYNSNTGQLEYTSSNTTNSFSNDYYDLRNEDKLPPVQNQGQAGDCWTFATIGSLESCLLSNVTANFSENNLKDLSGFDIGWNDGGFYEMSTAYLASWLGPVNSTDDPYNETSGVSPTNLTTTAHVQDVLVLPSRTSPLDNDDIKSALETYGAVGTYMEMDDSYMDKSTYGYYYNGTATYDHAVDIIGWDDNYSRYNFNIVPPGDGAFIVRNSWGTEWADGGYFYVSYYDTSLGTEASKKFSSDNFVFLDAEPVNNYNKIYQYDPLGWTDSIGYGKNTSWIANIFNSTGNDQLAAASFYIPAMNSTYTLNVYKNVSVGNPTSGILVDNQSGILNMGYWTIKLNQLTQLATNSLFSIVLKLTTPGDVSNILIQDKVPDYSSNATSAPNISFCSSNGESWYDLNNMNATACLKAFTILPPPVANFTANITSGFAPLTVQFNDTSNNNPTSWLWNFGDGSTSTMENPIHSYNIHNRQNST
jgi:C1A family cysteine protease